MRRLVLLTIGCALCAPSLAEKKKDESENLLIRPVVSPSGIQRIYDSIGNIQKTIRDAESNANLCEKNRQTVLGELAEMDKLEQEQLTLMKDYDKYIENAKIQMERNESGLKEISKWEADNRGKLGTGPAKNQQDLAAKLQTAHADRVSREAWRGDAQSKVARVNRLIAGAKANLGQIQTHRMAIKAQAAGWSAKRREFENVIKELIAKKNDIQRLAEVKKKELPTQNDDDLE